MIQSEGCQLAAEHLYNTYEGMGSNSTTQISPFEKIQ
jgi:hypothetical protein